MGLIYLVIIGAVAGYLATRIMRTGHSSIAQHYRRMKVGRADEAAVRTRARPA